MKRNSIRFFSFLYAFCVSTLSFAQAPTSVYSNLEGDSCKEVYSYEARCTGTAGYDLMVLDDDNRISIDIVFPDKKRYPLNYWDVVTNKFTSLGKKAEWRMINLNGKMTPLALIVRLYSQTLEEESQPDQSYLVIAKIKENQACVTNVVNGNQADANEIARVLADQAPDNPCM